MDYINLNNKYIYINYDFRDQMNEWGVQLKVSGRLTLLPEDVQALLAKAVLATKNNNKLRLNVAYAYTGK